MKTSVLRICLLGLLAAGITGTSVSLRAQDTNINTSTSTNTVEAKHLKARKAGVIPFHGALKSVDTVNKTLTIGERSIRVTSETKIEKDGKPATFEDAVVGELVNGAYKKGEDGKLNATKIEFGAKKHAKKKAAATETN